MSYLVLARKYRPHNFEEMVGQEHVVKALSNALEQQRLHHAYLFTGTRGVGKTTVSRILAKSLNCQGADGQGGITAHPCGICQACRDIDAGRFVDYTELDAASNRGVEEVQSLMEQAVYKPVQGRFKVFMIDEVHMLSNTAFNAMLKTLEEPPEYLKFVLATTDPQKVPVTVLSRCLQFNLRPMAPDTIAEHLGHVLQKESVTHDRASLQLLGRAARGSMRDALSLTDQAIAFGNGALQETVIRQMLGVVDKRYILDLIAALAAADGQRVVELCDGLRREGIAAASVLEDLALSLQKMALYQNVPAQASAAEAEQDADVRRLLELAGQLPPDETQLLYSFCLKGREELGLAPDEHAGLVMVLLRLLAFKAPPGSVAAVPAASAPAAATAGHGGDAANAASVASMAGETEANAAAPARMQGSEEEARPASPTGPGPSAAADAEVPVATVAKTIDAASHASSADKAEQPTTAGGAGAATRPRPIAAAPAMPAAMTGAEDTPPWEDVRPPTVPVRPERMAATPVAEAHANGPAAIPAQETPATPAEPTQPVQPVPNFAAETDIETAQPAAQPVSVAVLPQADQPLAHWWLALVQQLNADGQLVALVRELALQSELQSRSDQGMVLRVANQTLNNESLRGKLQKVLQLAGALSGSLSLEPGAVERSPAQLLEAQKNLSHEIARTIVENDPSVQWLRNNLGAEIVPGSIQPVAVQLPPAM
ncbi:DNA polymerase III subunit gamma/tau [Corticibacter populi]|uniref:DNA polymerase III subunit gamma/tau n=1 Tax=Corticibacter populi TaxID=1550736 RepID=A0A3M6QZ33_9BURK|nr:DNA polymerase III subunit gamma/tau [Corticibacter populi]RMX08286.1 DNA polymerase III subunit gamma/tau [Corticibacter populi]RZS35566.1 DNA polymerase-3 subunit gamma/tau [Corticibacter populi]